MNESRVILWINCKEYSSIIVKLEVYNVFTIQVLICSQLKEYVNKVCRWINQVIIVNKL